MGLALNLLDTPHLVAMHHQMTEFVSPIKPGTRSIILVSGEHHYWSIGEGQGKCVDVLAGHWHPDDDNTVVLKLLDHVADWASWHFPFASNLLGHSFDGFLIRVE